MSIIRPRKTAKRGGHQRSAIIGNCAKRGKKSERNYLTRYDAAVQRWEADNK